MSEPCHRCERFRVELADCKTLASKALASAIEQLTTERDGLLTTVATKDAAIDAMAAVIVAREATIARSRSIVDDPNAALVASRVRAALEATS